MIAIIAADPKVGKTAFLTAIAGDVSCNKTVPFDFTYIGKNRTIYSNYDFVLKSQGYAPRKLNLFNPFYLGMPDEKFPTIKIQRNSLIIIDEAYPYFYSRKSSQFPDRLMRFFPITGHMGFDILMATQRPMQIDSNIRDISAMVYEVLKVFPVKDKYGYVEKTVVDFIVFWKHERYAEYVNSGRRKLHGGSRERFVAMGNVYKRYDHEAYAESYFDHKKPPKLKPNSELCCTFFDTEGKQNDIAMGAYSNFMSTAAPLGYWGAKVSSSGG